MGSAPRTLLRKRALPCLSFCSASAAVIAPGLQRRCLRRRVAPDERSPAAYVRQRSTTPALRSAPGRRSREQFLWEAAREVLLAATLAGAATHVSPAPNSRPCGGIRAPARPADGLAADRADVLGFVHARLREEHC